MSYDFLSYSYVTMESKWNFTYLHGLLHMLSQLFLWDLLAGKFDFGRDTVEAAFFLSCLLMHPLFCSIGDLKALVFLGAVENANWAEREQIAEAQDVRLQQVLWRTNGFGIRGEAQGMVGAWDAAWIEPV